MGENQGATGFQPVDGFRETRRNLPHWQEPGATYFITFRVKAGHLPEAARQIAFDACLFWNGKKCDVHACVVLPDHVHMLVTPLPLPEGDSYHSLSGILHSIKSYSAKQINRLLRRQGTLWLDESYDRIMRGEKEFQEKWTYIVSNAVLRGLASVPEDYPFLYEEGGGAPDTGKMPVPPTSGEAPSSWWHRLLACEPMEGGMAEDKGGTGFQPVVRATATGKMPVPPNQRKGPFFMVAQAFSL